MSLEFRNFDKGLMFEEQLKCNNQSIQNSCLVAGIQELKNLTDKYQTVELFKLHSQVLKKELMMRNSQNEMILQTLSQHKCDLEKLLADLKNELVKKKLEVDKCRIILRHKTEEFNRKRKVIDDFNKNYSPNYELNNVIQFNKNLRHKYWEKNEIFKKSQKEYNEIYSKLQSNVNKKLFEFCTVLKHGNYKKKS